MAETTTAEKHRAKRMVRSAIEAGVLRRPNACDKCHEVPRPYRDGRSPVQAHHPDYSKPLEVEWLCIKCHRDETPVASGMRNAWHRLNDDLVEMIRGSSISTATLAKAFGVAFQTVWRVRHDRSWNSLAAHNGGKHE
jgi:hypothetical protein